MKVAFFIAIIMASMVAGQQQTLASFINDNNVLNYALTLENLEAAYYQQGLAAFNESAFNAAGFVPGVRGAISVIAAQEAFHASNLSTLLGARGWPAVSACTYNFVYTDVRSFVNTLATIEALGTEAYVGAAVGLTNKDLLNTAAGIASVEARHTAFIRYLLNQTTPFPDGNFTTAANFSTVVGQVAGFFNTCTPVTLSTSYNGSITVSSSNPASYQWASASTFRFPGNNANFFSLPAEAEVYLSSNLNGSIVNNDAKVLNYALILENLEANYYQTFAQAYSAANIQAAYPGLNSSLANAFSNVFGAIAAHELAHVQLLNTFLTSLKNNGPGANFNITPGAPSCTYNWTVLNAGLANPAATNFSVFLAVAYTLESTGVKAYNGAVDKIIIPTIAQTAASIHTVEAEHTAFLAQLFQSVASLNVANGTQTDAFDYAYDYPNATQPSGVVAIVGPVLSSACTAGIALPGDVVVNYFNDAKNNAGAPFATGTATNTATGTNANTNNGGATGTNANTNNGGATGTNANTNNGGATGSNTAVTNTNGNTTGTASFFALSMIVAAFAALVM